MRCLFSFIFLRSNKNDDASPLQMHGNERLDKYQWTTAGHARVQEDVVLHHAKRYHTAESYGLRSDVLRRRSKARQKEIAISETRRCK